MEKYNKYIKCFTGIGVVLFIFLLFGLNLEITDAISYSLSTTSIIFVSYMKLLWKLNPLEGTPKLSKKYVSKIKYEYNGKNESKTMKVEVKQDLVSVKITMKSTESFSKSIISTLHKEHDVWYLTYTYINEPDQDVRSRSQIHYGTCRLNLNDLSNIKGEYFTDRLSQGKIEWKIEK